MVNVFPEQTDPLLTLITGREFTTTVATAAVVATQPAALVPVME
jgi:hypothetical protein